VHGRRDALAAPPAEERAWTQTHPHNACMSDLRIVTDDGGDENSTPEPSRSEEAWAGPYVPPGHVVRTGYVPVHDVVCHVTGSHQLNPAAVERAYRDQLAADDAQPWPPPTGYWRADGRFVLTDGRTRFVAALMLGRTHVLAAWLEPPSHS